MEPCQKTCVAERRLQYVEVTPKVETADWRISIKKSDWIESGRDPNNVELECLPSLLCSTDIKGSATLT